MQNFFIKYKKKAYKSGLKDTSAYLSAFYIVVIKIQRNKKLNQKKYKHGI